MGPQQIGIRAFVRKLIKKMILIADRAVLPRKINDAPTGVALIHLDAIGDFVIWLDAAKEFRRIYPDQRITLIANAAWADLAGTLPYWDNVWPVRTNDLMRKPFYRWALLRRVFRANFKTAIQPAFSRTFTHGDSVMRATKAVNRIGWAGDLANISPADKETSDLWYTRLLPASSAPMMELLRNAEFIGQLTGQVFSAALPRLPVRPAISLEKKPNQAYFILFPGASMRQKQWPASNFADLLARLHRQYGWQAVLCGSLAERELCESIAVASGVSCENLAGKTTLVELAELVRIARILVSNDTSAVHISTAVGRPAVCILGGGHFGRFMPYPKELAGIKPVVAVHTMACFNCNWHCTQPHDANKAFPCIDQIPVEQVLRCVQQAIE